MHVSLWIFCTFGITRFVGIITTRLCQWYANKVYVYFPLTFLFMSFITWLVIIIILLSNLVSKKKKKLLLSNLLFGLLSQRKRGDTSHGNVSLSLYILSSTISYEKLKRLVAMENQYSLLYLSLLLSFSLLHEHIAYAAGTNDGSEHWGYVEVRPSNKAIFTCKIFLHSFYVNPIRFWYFLSPLLLILVLYMCNV